MIGQRELKRIIERQLDNKNFPRFSVISGAGEMDKKELVNYIADKLKCTCITVDSPKVDEVREIIKDAYIQRNPTVYALLNFDKVSLQAKNAMLKVTEEPQNNAYIIIGVADKNNLLKTLRSRAAIYQMDHYSSQELQQYIDGKYRFTDDENEIVLNVCETPDEVDLLAEKYKILEFYDFVELVVNNIAEVSGANSFKIAEKLKIKDSDEDKIDLGLFFKCFMVICAKRYKQEKDKRYVEWVKVTSKAFSDLKNASLNKQMLVDNWILNIRRAWMT